MVPSYRPPHAPVSSTHGITGRGLTYHPQPPTPEHHGDVHVGSRAHRAILYGGSTTGIGPPRRCGLPVRTRRAAGRSKRCEDGLYSKERRWERTWRRTVPRYRTWSTRNFSVMVECQDQIVTHLRLSKKVPKSGLSQGPARRSCSCNLKLEGQDQACFSHTKQTWNNGGHHGLGELQAARFFGGSQDGHLAGRSGTMSAAQSRPTSGRR